MIKSSIELWTVSLDLHEISMEINIWNGVTAPPGFNVNIWLTNLLNTRLRIQSTKQ